MKDQKTEKEEKVIWMLMPELTTKEKAFFKKFIKDKLILDADYITLCIKLDDFFDKDK